MHFQPGVNQTYFETPSAYIRSVFQAAILNGERREVGASNESGQGSGIHAEKWTMREWKKVDWATQFVKFTNALKI